MARLASPLPDLSRLRECAGRSRIPALAAFPQDRHEAGRTGRPQFGKTVINRPPRRIGQVAAERLTQMGEERTFWAATRIAALAFLKLQAAPDQIPQIYFCVGRLLAF